MMVKIDLPLLKRVLLFHCLVSCWTVLHVWNIWCLRMIAAWTFLATYQMILVKKMKVRTPEYKGFVRVLTVYCPPLPSAICTGKNYLKLSSAIKKATQSKPRKQQQQQQRRRIKKEPSQSASPSGVDQTATVVSAPPKRSKMSKIPAKTRRVQPIERDEAGNPILPQQIGVLTVLKLGSIEPHREAFHNERYIFPVGYTVSR